MAEPLHALLGLEPTGLVELTRAGRPPSRTARGFRQPRLEERLATLGRWRPVGSGLYRADDAPGFFALPATAVDEVLVGELRTVGDLAGFDSDAGRVVLRFHDAEGDRALDAERGEVVVVALGGPGLGVPPVDAWSTGMDPWLRQAAAALAASPSVVDRAAAAGLVARLGMTTEDPPLRERVRAWVRGQERALPALERQAVERAWTLADRLRGLAEASAEVDARVAALVAERDDLQSVRRVLVLVGQGARLREALAAVDALAAELAGVLDGHLPALESDPEAERWIAVAWQEPGAWWTGT